MASYFFTEVFESSCLISSILTAVPLLRSFIMPETVSFLRLSTSSPVSSSSHLDNCCTDLGLLNPVISLASSIRLSVTAWEQYKAPSMSFSSTATPVLFIIKSNRHSSISSAGTEYLSKMFFIDISVTTSCLQYSLNNFHFSGSCCGSILTLGSVFVGLRGTQNFLIRLKPTPIFLLSCGSPIASPTEDNPAG